MKRIRTAIIGAGAFGRNHARVISQLPEVELTAIVDIDRNRAEELAAQHGYAVYTDAHELIGKVDAAIIAVPTNVHEAVARPLLEAGVDLLIEKPIADSSAAGQRLVDLAQRAGRILQVGHLERFNPAVMALERALTQPLFFEVHRLSIFTPRSLDIDVVLDLMIHDLDIILSFTKEQPEEIRAAGISVLSDRVDIANVRLAFPSGCVANLTASRVSTEKIRKLRLFQPHQYISLDYERQEAAAFTVSGERQIGFSPLVTEKAEPLWLELTAFFEAVRDRKTPRVTAEQATNALRVAEAILDKIKEHAELVSATLRQLG